jgi:hypothetical protein
VNVSVEPHEKRDKKKAQREKLQDLSQQFQTECEYNKSINR